MKESLYIRLRPAAPDAPLAAALWSPEGGLQNVSGTLAELAARAPGRRVVAFVPAADVRLAAIDVPARSAQKVLQAAPYALEEQLAEDVETQHFALGPRQLTGGYPVAVVAKSRMDTWLGTLAAANIRPQVLAPEDLCLPWSGDDRFQMLAEPGEITARTGAFQGFSCAADDLPVYLRIADPENRYGLRVFVTNEFTPQLPDLGRPIELLPGHRSILEILVKNWRPETSINLLQGAYAMREERNPNWARWRLPATVAAGWVVATLVSGGVQAYRLNRDAAQQHARNVERFQQLFPEEKKIVDLSAQAEQRMAALKGGTTNQGLLKLLEPAAAAMIAVPGVGVQELQFRDGALYLNLTARDLQTWESLRTWFEQYPGAKIDPQSVNAGATGVQIKLKLTAA